jgi:proteasome lid subunit RPN8/RPN11
VNDLPEMVRIARRALAAIDVHARREAPRECCGLLVGAPDHVIHAEPTRNLAIKATRYEIDPADHFRILRAARAGGLAVIGAYHSHPFSEPAPSASDLEDGLTHFLYIIARPVPGDVGSDVRAYWLDGPHAPARAVRLVAVEE